jgi:hypothetical protein
MLASSMHAFVWIRPRIAVAPQGRLSVLGRRLTPLEQPLGNQPVVLTAALLSSVGTEIVVTTVERDDRLARGTMQAISGWWFERRGTGTAPLENRKTVCTVLASVFAAALPHVGRYASSGVGVSYKKLGR